MRNKKLRVLITCGAAALIFTGCKASSNSSESNASTVAENTKDDVKTETMMSKDLAEMWAVRINDTTVTQAEYYLYLIQYLFNHGYKEDNITEDIKTAAIDSCVYQIRLDELEYAEAKKNSEIKVTDEDLETGKTQAKNFYEYFGKNFLDEFFITEEMVYSLFEKQVYVNKYNDLLMTNIAKEYYASFEKKYKDYTFHNMYYVLFPSYEVDSDGKVKKDADGNIVKISEEKKAENKEKAEELQKKAAAGEDIKELAKEYGVDKYSDTQININGAYTEEMNKIVESLSDGQLSDVVEVESGYMIVLMNKREDQDYKAYWLQYMSYQQAQSAITSTQEKIVKDANLPETDVDDYVMMTTDLALVCKRMAAHGITSNSSSETTASTTANTTEK